MELLKLNRSMQGPGPGPGSSSLCRPGVPLLNSSSSSNLSCEPPRLRGTGTRELELAIRVTLYAVIFLMSVGGNVLIIVVLGLSRRLRTVTNAFLLSLAVSDLLLAVACMPFTLLPNLMGTFIFGTVICKAVSYLMVQPVGPRVLQCVHRWPSARVRQTWSVLLLILLFFVPGVVMAVAYGLISRELYLGLRFDDEDSETQSRVRNQGGLPGGAAPGSVHQNGACRPETSLPGEDSDGCYVQLPRSRLEMTALTTPTPGPGPGPRPNQAKLLAKKRVVRMLLVIVVLFFLCWLPVYSANTWRAFDGPGAHRALSGAPISFIHLLSYASACVNPLVYCFMHRRFRQACLDTCARCCPRPPRARPRPLPDEDPPTPSIASLSRLSYTTISTLGPG
ncbi:gastrin/cholecystokinin type B receptor isoform X2 [Peromyscus californicus insignis]|uniref:gastrin/cholecystokinin type B receptor isoform X2 n=1 Tax=Peromyscus californicus insignis TaxID=564181 RepID=UPI0022A7EAE1|nr:gastrin/cholecystokinin type B receptor isoform X2 [Peromyscus californicus insignis]